MERQLVEHLKFLESKFFGLTRKDVLELGYQLAMKNEFEYKFNNDKKTVGKVWFRKRYPDISLRKPEPTIWIIYITTASYSVRHSRTEVN